MPRYSEVSEPEIARTLKHQVLRFQVSVDDVVVAQVLECKHDASHYKLCISLLLLH